MIFKSLCRHPGIGANSYLLETAEARVILDSGMHPKHEGIDATPLMDLVEEASVDAVVVTHSHLDHVGTLPMLLERQPHAKVFLSPETAELSAALLHNSVNVMQAKRIELGISEYPLFDHGDIDRISEGFEHKGIERPFDLDYDGTLRATFHDAGHILGSVAVTIKGDGKTILYTGDVNFEDATVQKGALLPEETVDALIIETTRGDHARRPDYDRNDEENALAAGIAEVLARGGSVLIPVFAMGKTQEVLAMVERFKNDGLVPAKTPVYIGGLSTKMTMIYDRYCTVSRRKLPGFRFLKDMDLEAGSRKRTGPIPFLPGCIYALSSGMMTEKTVSNNFARQGLLENPKHGLFFVGYADPDSPGGRIRASQKGDDVLLDPAYPPVKLNCDVRVFDFSGHAPREALLDYICKVNPKKTFLVHGDDPAVEWFRSQLATRLPATEVIIPKPGDSHEI